MPRGDFGWDYPPGVIGNEPQIAGPPYDDDACALCGEGFTDRDEKAEMNDPDDPLNGGLVHAECGIDAGWEIS